MNTFKLRSTVYKAIMHRVMHTDDVAEDIFLFYLSVRLEGLSDHYYFGGYEEGSRVDF